MHEDDAAAVDIGQGELGDGDAGCTGALELPAGDIGNLNGDITVGIIDVRDVQIGQRNGLALAFRKGQRR